MISVVNKNSVLGGSIVCILSLTMAYRPPGDNWCLWYYGSNSMGSSLAVCYRNGSIVLHHMEKM